MPQDLLAPQQPRDLLADISPAPAPAEESTVLGEIGDWIIDNTVGGVSADMLENARTGTFKQDAAQDEGLLDYIGSKLERGGAWFDRGLYDVLGGLGSQKAREAANTLDRGTVSQAISGDTGWEDVKDVSSLGKFIGGSGVESLPSMAALAVPWVGPLAVGASQTGNIARERAANDGGGEVTSDLLGEALPYGIASTALDRLGLKGIKNPAGNTVTGRIAGAATREGLTEAAQSGIENVGSTAGTERGFDLFEMFDQVQAGGVAGFGLGGGVRGGAEIVQPVVSRVGKVRGQNQPVAGGRQDEDFDGSLDDLLQGETEPRDLLALPSPEMVQRREAAPVARPVPPAPVAAAPDFAAVKAAIRVPESGGNDNVTNRAGSSASGRYQFIESTFKNLYQRVYGVNSAMANQAWQTKRFDPAVQERLMDALLEENSAILRRAGVEPDTGNLYVAHFAGAARAARLAKADPNAPVSQFFNKQEIAQNQSYLGGGKTVAQALETIRGKVGGAGTGSVSPDTDIAAVDIPGADGSLLGRGGDERIANLDIPEASPEQREAGRATPIDIDFGSEQGAQQSQQAQTDAPAITPIAPLPPAQAVGNISQVTTARGETVDTEFELRDLSELVPSSSPNYDQTLQPRDRASRATSDAQVASIAANLDPAQLGDSRLASTGAPIIGPDGQVESGNGRVSAIARAYQTSPERAQAYRQMIEAQGFDTSGMQNPVLVRRRTTDMTPEQRQAWTRAANERDTMAMSSTEQASADARALDDVTLGMYRGGAVTAAANRDFVRAFIQKAVSPAERNAMTASDGSISADGVRRVRFALLARAYGDTELIARISEDTDTNIAAIGKALLEAAPAMARMKAKIASGDIPAQYDLSGNIADAARIVSRSRESGQSIAGMLAQTDAFSEPPAPETVEVLRTFFRDEGMKRPRSGQKVADILINYAQEVDALGDRAKQGDDMFGNAPQMPPPAEVLRDQRLLLDGDMESQRDLLAIPPESATTQADEQGNRPDGRPATVRPDQGEPDGGPDRAVPTLARGQLRALGITQELRARSSAALIGRTASTPKELAEIAQIYRDPRYETFRIFYTKGNEIVHATGVSTRSIAEAAIMPEDMSYGEFLAEIERTKKRSGADGYYLLHNHPSGRPDPSPADKTVTRQIATSVDGFRGHVVINSGKFAEIQVDKAGRSRTNIRDLNVGEDNLLKPSVSHNAIGAKANGGVALAILAKNLQKPGYVTVIGTDASAKVRVIVEFADGTVKKDAKTLMAMGRRIMRQSGSASLFLVGDRDVLSSPVVSRALQAGMVTAAFDSDGRPLTEKVARKNKMPTGPSRYVAEDQSTFADTIEVDGKQRPTQNSNGQPIAKDDESLRNFWRWFGDSKVVDEQGRPLVVYHGAPDARDITSEDGSFKSHDQIFGGKRQGVHWFAKDRKTALTYADDRRAFDYQGAEPAIIEAYIRLENPDISDAGGKDWNVAQQRGRTSDVIREAIGAGNDGIIIGNVFDNYNDNQFADMTTTYAVFSDTQIKSVNNRGTFDAEDPRILREAKEPWSEGAGEPEGGPQIIDKLVDRDGLKRDAQAIRDAVGNPVNTLRNIARSGMADIGRSIFYTMDARMRGLAKRYDSEAIHDLADMFHARAGKTDRAVDETYHEAIEREGFGRAARAWRILGDFIKDKEAMDRIGMMLRNPTQKQRGRMAEVRAAAEIAKLLKDTIDYRKKAGEDIGEVSDGYFPRFMDVEKVVKNKDLFMRQATELYRKNGAENPEASASAWMARIFDQYAGLDGGLEYASLFHDTRPAGVGRKTTKGREFGKDADQLLGSFYDNDTGSVLTGYFIGAARKAEEARRFGVEADGQAKLRKMMNQIKRDVRASGEDAGDVLDTIATMVNTNLGRIEAPGQAFRTTASILHTAGQLGTLDRATYTSLSEAMMGFVRAGPKYGLTMLTDSAKEFARQLKGSPPSEVARMAEVLGIASDVMVAEAMASRNGYEMSNTTRRAQKVQTGFFQATGLHQWTEGTRTAATRIGQKFMADMASDVLAGRNAARAGGYLKELGIKDPKAFAKWLAKGNTPTPETITQFNTDPFTQQYRGALVRFVNQTIMKPTRAEKPAWASHPVYGLAFSLMSFSYGFKKNVLDRVARQTKDAVKTKDMTLLYPAFGMAGLFAVHTVLQNVLREAIFGGGREDDEEGIDTLDVIEAVDRAGLTGAASRPLNALLSLKYRASVIESMAGPTIGRPMQLIEDLGGLATEANSDNTNTAERKAAGALYDVVLEPGLEAYGVTRLKKPVAAALVWGSGNREGGTLPADRDYFIEAVAGPKKD